MVISTMQSTVALSLGVQIVICTFQVKLTLRLLLHVPNMYISFWTFGPKGGVHRRAK